MSISFSVRTPERAVRRYGGHSMTAPLRRVMVRKPAPPVADDQWRSFGYVHAIDHAAAEREHAAFRETLTREGIEVVEAEAEAPGDLDAIFAYDPSIMTDRGAVLLRPGKPVRRSEPAAHAATYAEIDVPILGAIEEPGTVEGGDTLWVDERTLAVGRGYRTNAHGIAQLTAILAQIGVEVLPFDLPHWHGEGECLHLMSLISPVAADLAVVYPPLMAVSFIELLLGREWRMLPVPDEEFISLGCNVLALAPGRVLMVEGNPETRRRLEAAGCEVLTYAGHEISLNREGGPTCLTRPILREREPGA